MKIMSIELCWKQKSMNSQGQRKRIESGQALVESAIILPLFIFMLLGILQMGLIYQARYLLKYAAYRSVRTGALLHANKKAMKEAALSVMAPVIGLGDGYSRTDDFVSYLSKFGMVSATESVLSLGNISLLNVQICGPTTQHISSSGEFQTFKVGNEVEFDAYENLAGSSDVLNAFEKTKLRIQLQYYHQLVIPFANIVIFKSWMGMNQLRELRMQNRYVGPNGVPGVAPAAARVDDVGNGHRRTLDATTKAALVALAFGKKIFLPMHSNYAFRMQSNLYHSSSKEEFALPQDNRCWHYSDGAEGAL